MDHIVVTIIYDVSTGPNPSKCLQPSLVGAMFMERRNKSASWWHGRMATAIWHRANRTIFQKGFKRILKKLLRKCFQKSGRMHFRRLLNRRVRELKRYRKMKSEFVIEQAGLGRANLWLRLDARKSWQLISKATKLVKILRADKCICGYATVENSLHLSQVMMSHWRRSKLCRFVRLDAQQKGASKGK